MSAPAPRVQAQAIMDAVETVVREVVPIAVRSYLDEDHDRIVKRVMYALRQAELQRSKCPCCGRKWRGR